MSKYSEPKHIRLYHLQEDLINSILSDKQYCYNHGISTTADIIRNSLSQYLKSYELDKVHRQINK